MAQITNGRSDFGELYPWKNDVLSRLKNPCWARVLRGWSVEKLRKYEEKEELTIR
jgi:hypothetical protein